ncbi:MAG: ribosome recycling factor [Buchnera aphidicola (Brevicoryne brassicae)]|uniref:Ribosome-recycling factor n=1 Tax=Buchnera aphidicola (Brevicoryne brassicae) TaxID=911343 RepID=A0AAJ5PUV0_9GAMM|nr:ribosome recycling factor [Buchnera aphidicola]QCI19804.1 ribosome recycling factor [Buchnera aphidicola (Brevicoryne brassicae)]WAI19179.1 MAG: ribosome recycling factor [Buchnera aphidicola (Brevicoryne brassicae)]
MINKININSDERMKACIQIFQNNVNNIRIGRASPLLLNNIYIEYFGVKTALRQVANIIVEDSHSLRINVFDSSVTPLIKKSILNANLDLNPILNGKDIIIKVPALTEERRKNLIKVIRNDAENSRICVRNIRRDSNDKIKKLIKEKIISKDEERLAQIKIQTMTNEYVKEIESILLKKEIELMKV